MNSQLHKILIIAACIVSCAPALSAPTVWNYFFAKKTEEVSKELRLGIIKITDSIDDKVAEDVIRKILQFQDDSRIKGVLLVVSSGGGDSGIGELLSREIAALNMAKPVTTIVASCCLSAAYRIAIGSAWIISPSSAMIGSIGSFTTIEKHRNIKYTDKKYAADAEFELIHAGKHKISDHRLTAPLNEEDRLHIKERVNDVYKLFYTSVAQQRNLSLDKLPEWGEGQLLTGEKALELGLIDQVGGYSDAVKKLVELIKERAGSAEGKIVFVE